MNKADDALLEFLRNAGSDPIAATPLVIAHNIDYTGGYVRKEVRKLHTRGLIEYADESNGLYQITKKGIAYLDGELSAEDLE